MIISNVQPEFQTSWAELVRLDPVHPVDGRNRRWWGRQADGSSGTMDGRPVDTESSFLQPCLCNRWNFWSCDLLGPVRRDSPNKESIPQAQINGRDHRRTSEATSHGVCSTSRIGNMVCRSDSTSDKSPLVRFFGNFFMKLGCFSRNDGRESSGLRRTPSVCV